MSGIVHHDGNWREPASGRTYRYRLWRPAAPRTLLILLHGFGEHGGRYAPMAERFAADGLAVAVPDLWGHGRSGGTRGDLGEPMACVEHLHQLTEAVLLPASGCSRHALFGHSFGGLAAILWALRFPQRLTRLIAQSPLLEVGFPLPAWKVWIARFLAPLWPTFRVPLQLDLTYLSHQSEVIASYRADPLVHAVMSVRTYWALLRARDWAVQQAAALQIPLLLLCGGDDHIISLAHAQQWAARVRCEKRVVIFPGMYHELHHEAVSEEALRLIADWSLTDAPVA